MTTDDFIINSLKYDHVSGLVYWIIKNNRTKLNAIAGWNHNGYVRIKIKGISYLAHRIAWLLHYGKWPQNQIDHINGNRSDNRILNLRDISPRVNAINNNKYRLKKSVGVKYNKISGKWYSQIKINKKTKHLGVFDTKKQANAAYMKKLKQIDLESYNNLLRINETQTEKITETNRARVGRKGKFVK